AGDGEAELAAATREIEKNVTGAQENESNLRRRNGIVCGRRIRAGVGAGNVGSLLHAWRKYTRWMERSVGHFPVNSLFRLRVNSRASNVLQYAQLMRRL